MKHVRFIAGTIAIMIACAAQAEIYTFESSGVITDYSPGFGGGDQFPFVGLSAGDSLFYHFEYDINTIPVFDNGTTKTWEIAGTNSYAMLGSTRVDFDWIRIIISSDGVSSAGVGFNGFVDDIGVNAGLSMDGPVPMAVELPTSIDVNSFSWARNAGADSNQNNILFPIVLGTVDTVTVVPAPGAMGVVIGGVGFFGRRRR